jgi:hypothetical protein
LGKSTAQRLRERGVLLHLIADHYPDDAAEVRDEAWIEEGCRRGWVLLTKDKRIRYRAKELAALDGYLFCLVGGNATIDEMSGRLLRAMPAIERAVHRGQVGFWHVDARGGIRRMWPT